MMGKPIDWKTLNGKSLKIYVAENDGSIIGIDEETGKAYLLRQESPFVIRTSDSSMAPIAPLSRKGKGIFGL